jgi:hypothetical protein
MLSLRALCLSAALAAIPLIHVEAQSVPAAGTATVNAGDPVHKARMACYQKWGATGAPGAIEALMVTHMNSFEVAHPKATVAALNTEELSYNTTLKGIYMPQIKAYVDQCQAALLAPSWTTQGLLPPSK